MKKSFSFRVRQAGATIIEAMAAMVIMGIIIAGGLQMKANDARDAVADNAAVMSIRVQNAIRTYRTETGSWPTNTGQLVSTGKLTSAEALSPFGTGYSFATSGTNLVVTVNANNAVYARRIAGLLPGGTISGNSYSYRIQPPGSEASLAGLYSLDGSKALTGNMNANGNSINNVNTVNATNLNAPNANITSLSTSTISTSVLDAATRINSSGTITANGELVSNTGIHTPGDITAGSTMTASYLQSNGNIYAANEVQAASINSRGGMYAQGQITAAGHIRSLNDISAANAISANYIKSYGNVGIDGTADMNRIIVNENVYNPGYMYSRRYVDYDNPNTYMHLGGTSRLSDLEVLGQMRLSQSGANIGTSCSAGGISFNSSQQLMTCKNGVWETIQPEAVTTLGAYRGDADIGKLHIRQMWVSLTKNSIRDFYYSTPIPAGAFITCTATHNWVAGTDEWGEPRCNCDNNKCTVVNPDNSDTLGFNIQVIGIRG